jgi:iron uptake system component EfeO
MVAGCGSSGGAADSAGGLTVTATDAECAASAASVTSGVSNITFKNRGSKENEIYVLRPDGSIIAERENVGPGLTVTLTVELPAGSYVVQCKPGMVGKGIQTPLTVTGVAASASAAADLRLATAVAAYRTYVEDQVTSSLTGAKALQAAVAAGDLAGAQAAYAASRVGWERIEPVAESFGDLDPKIDLREADLEVGQTWTGWHVIEKGLFQARSTANLQPVAVRLVADLTDLDTRVRRVEITPTGMANGAKELLDEVSATKITGEEEFFSHTDLVDIQANVAGARQVVELLRPALQEKDAALLADLDARFAALQTALDGHRSGTGDAAFVSYEKVTQEQRRTLSGAVDAVSEPLSKLAAGIAP